MTRTRVVASVLLLAGGFLLFFVGGPTAQQPGTGSSPHVIRPGDTASPGAPKTPADVLITVVAPPSSLGPGATADRCAIIPNTTSHEVILVHGTNAQKLCDLQVRNGWIAYHGEGTGTRRELCGMTDGTVSGEDLVDVFDAAPYNDGVTTCHALQGAGWGASAFWPVLEGFTPAPDGPGLPPDYFG